MVRETRHLWVGNLPDNIREDRIREHFKRYGRVQNVKLLGRPESASAGVGANGASGICAAVAFMDIKSASKAHNTEHVLDERTLTTEYYEPAAIPPAAGAPSAGSSPAGSGYSGSSSSLNSAPAPSSAPRYHLSGGEDSSGAATCPLAASAAAPANWRGTNDSATEYCRRGNTPATYGRYQRNNSTAPFSTPPSNVERTTPHNRWYASSERAGATGGESTPSTPGGGTESGRRRRLSGSASSRSDSSSPEPSDTSRASTPPTQTTSHNNHRTPTSLPHQWASTASGRPLAICVRNLPTRSTDSSLKDGLYHEYKKHGKVVWVKVVGQNADRYAVVRFKKPSDVEKALEVSQDKLFFGCKISVAPHQSGDDDAESAKPYETDIDEYHPKATRTLFIGNLEKDVTQQQLRDKFKHFGRIIEIDIKKGSGGGAGYAFCQYASISSVVEAIRAMDGEYVGGSRVKLGFGKPVATACVWVDGLTEHTESQVLKAVSRIGCATSVCVDRAAGAALVHFEQAASASAAVRELRRVAAAATAAEPDVPRLCVDYASRECQDAFYEQLEKHGGTAALAGSERLGSELTGRYAPTTRHDSLRFEGSRSRASSFGRSSSRTPRYSGVEPYDPVDYAADRRYRVYDEPGTSPPPDDAVPFDDRLQSVVVSPHRGRRHRRDSSPEDRRHSKERLQSVPRSTGRGNRKRQQVRRRLRRKHRREDGSGSRAGTPLRDEPDAPPAEPRRPPRDRPALPMCLPLPKFAAQIPRAAPPAPRPAPPPPAPDSPPRPPSVSSSSAGSAPHSPSLEERIRSLDEKYEKWSGTRVKAEAPDRARLRHRLLEVDINEVKPSEVVRSLLAKRSVFDEDSERLEVSARAPSPPGTPRSRSEGGSTPRALRYPPAPSSHHLPDYDRDLDPRLRRLDRSRQPELSRSITDNDYTEFRGRPRTPSLDRSEQLSIDRRSPSTLDGELESRSRDSASGTCDAESKSSLENDDKDARLEKQRERSNSTASDSFMSIRNDGLENIPMPLSKNASGERTVERVQSPVQNHFSDENCAHEVMEMILKKVENNQKFHAALETTRKLSKYEFRNDDGHKKQVFEGNKFCVDKNKKIETTSEIFDINLGIQEQIEHELQNHINEDIAVKSKEHELQNHTNESTAVNCRKENPDCISNLHSEVNKHSEKIRSNHGSQIYRNTHLVKENIQNDKNVDKVSGSILSTVDNLPTSNKSHQDNEKHIEDRSKNDKDNKLRHNRNKDKHENDKDKTKHIRQEKSFEKDKKIKEENHLNDKHVIDKNDGTKSIEKKDKSERESEKSRHCDDKARHMHHRRDSKSEKDKRKDSEDVPYSKAKKEDKHKLEKVKKENDSKRDHKKDSETVKSRKSSRDESSKEISQKDSIDSSTSKFSFETKITEIDGQDLKEDIKPKIKLTDLFVKLEKNKDFISTKDSFSTKIKHEHDKVDAQSAQTDHVTRPKADIVDKQRHHSVDSPSVDSKRKERLNSCSSLPSNIGHKRRVSSQDNFDLLSDETKKIKSEPKVPERRESKDGRLGERNKTAKFSKGHFAKIIESKTKDDKKNQVKPPDDTFVVVKEEIKDDVPSISRSIKKSPKEDSYDSATNEHTDDIHNNLDFLALLELRSSEEDEKQKALRKEMKEKKRIQQLQQIQELQLQQEVELGKLKEDKKQKSEDKKRESVRDKRMSTERKSREDKGDNGKRKIRKNLQSSDSSDSDEPIKHSIFDIIDDGPTYISMYDKVKARSCKNMQKQEEEKRQEKIKAKFSQLKQSRAKREEKKRSSWDEDSDSDQDMHRKKSSFDSSDDDGSISNQNTKQEKLHCPNLEFNDNKSEDYYNMPLDDENRNKLSRKNSRSRIISDTSDDESSKNKSFYIREKKGNVSDSGSPRAKTTISNMFCDDKTTKNSLFNLFGKSDSDDSKLKSSLENDNRYKPLSTKSYCNDLSSECESVSSSRNADVRRKHKKKQKKHKPSFSDEENKIETSDTGTLDPEVKHKKSIKQRRHSSKKDKRKDKIRESNDTDEGRDDKPKTKRDNKSPDTLKVEYGNDIFSNSTKRDDKMEDIFGPLSDESENGNKRHNNKSDFSSHDYDSNFGNETLNSMEKDQKRKKEKRRKEKRWFRDDENSLDVDAVGKAIEANLLTITDDSENIKSGGELKCIGGSLIKDVKSNSKYEKLKRDSKEKRKKKKRSREERLGRKDHHYLYNPDSFNKPDREIIDSVNVDAVSNVMLLDIPLPNDTISAEDKLDDCKSLSQSPSLPRLTESPPILIESSQDADIKSPVSSISNIVLSGDDNSEFLVDGKDIEIEQIPMPPPFENIVQDISEVPLPADPAPTISNDEKLDELKNTLNSNSDSSEDGVGSCFNCPIEEIETEDFAEEHPEKLDSLSPKEDKVDNLSPKPDKIVILSPKADKIDIPSPKADKHDILSPKADKKPEEKPRAIISQEETEDAVAALLGESFGGKVTFSSYEETESSSVHQTDIENTTLSTENIPEEDAEEMRQAVQNLNACEMEIKPDTPVSDSDLFIDTDTEEADETPQDATEKIPTNIIATNPALNTNSEQVKSTSEANTETANQLSKTDKQPVSLEPIKTMQQPIETTKNLEVDVKIKLARRENVQVITSTATPVITSWTLTNNKLREPQHVINVQPNKTPNSMLNDIKPHHLSSNIVQIKTPLPQNMQANTLVKPVLASVRPSYQVLSQMVRPQSSNVQARPQSPMQQHPQSSNMQPRLHSPLQARPQTSIMQPPTIKIPEQHIIYQKPQGIVISPRISNDPRMLSPKPSPQAEVTSPRITNMTIITSTPQNSTAMMSPTSKLQRSPGQMTVVRMQQPPLSPIQTLHGVHGSRAIMSPNRPNSVLIQGGPLHYNRLPVTPVLTPISKQINVNNALLQNKNTVVTSTHQLVPLHKNISAENRKVDTGNTYGNKNENAKIILSPTSLHHSNNPTVMAQNRLITMQNAVHLSNINPSIHLGNKVVINKLNAVPENHVPKSEQVNHSPFGSSPVIHVATSYASSPSIIQSGAKSILSNIQEPNVSRGPHSASIIHTINSQRLMTPLSTNNVIQLDKSKITPSVLSMATLRPTTVLAKLETSGITAVSTSSTHPILLKPLNNIRINTKPSLINTEPNNSESKSLERNDNIPMKKNESEQNVFLLKLPKFNENITKCETDFEELLKENEIKVTNNHEKKLEVNVGKNTTLITANKLPEKQNLKVSEISDIEKGQKDPSTPERVASDLALPNKKDDNSTNTQNIHQNNVISCKASTSDSVGVSLASSNKSDIKSSEVKQEDENLNTTGIAKIVNAIGEKVPSQNDDTKTFDFLKVENPSKEIVSLSDEVDNQLRNIDDDAWSVKDLNIESVIKKVDSLCNDPIQTHEDYKKNEIVQDEPLGKVSDSSSNEPTSTPETTVNSEFNVQKFDDVNGDQFNVSAKRGGRKVRGKKGQKGQDRVQTRQISKPTRGTTAKRGRGRAKLDKKVKDMVSSSASSIPGDVYDFHEDSGDETSKAESRPRLILTIKSPLSGQAGVTATSTLSISQKDQNKITEKLNKDEKIEDFLSPSMNTRKSRRLQEKDGHRNNIDETGDDGGSAQSRLAKRRPPRQGIGKVSNTNEQKLNVNDTRKSPRGNKRTRDRSLSDASVDSGDGETKREETARDPKVPRLDDQFTQSAETIVGPTPQLGQSGQPAQSAAPSYPAQTVPSPTPAAAPQASVAPASLAPAVAPPAAPPLLPAIPTPITKPPKKMISEISAKLASAFEAAAAQHLASPEPARDGSPAAPATGDAHAGDARRPCDSLPGACMPVGATEASDARVTSPALPHRAPDPARLRQPGRATPILVRVGEGEACGNAGIGAAAAAGAARYRGCGAASLPRGAHLPPPEPAPPPLPYHHPHSGAASRITSIPAISPQGQMPLSAELVRSPPPAHQQTSPVTPSDGMYPHFSHQHYQMYQHHFRATQHEPRTTQSPFTRTLEAEGSEAPQPPLVHRPPTARVPRPAHSPSTADRHNIMYGRESGRSPPPAHTSGVPRVTGALPPSAAPGPPHASQVPREADSLQMLLRRYPVMWQGLLALKNDSAAVQMHFVGGNPGVAGDTLARAPHGTPMLRIAQRMRLEPAQLDTVHRKMMLENEHCILLALPCGRDHMDVLLQSTNLSAGFITYLQHKQAAGIVNIAPPGHQQAMFTVHVFPSCDFANENLTRIAPDLMHRVADIAHLLIVIATV